MRNVLLTANKSFKEDFGEKITVKLTKESNSKLKAIAFARRASYREIIQDAVNHYLSCTPQLNTVKRFKNVKPALYREWFE